MKKIIVVSFILLSIMSCTIITPIKEQINILQYKNNLNKYKNDKDIENWNITNIDTAENEQYLSLIEKNIILELNKVRTNPVKYSVLYIEPRLNSFDGKIFSDRNINIETTEGAIAVKECINELKSTSTKEILKSDKNAYNMAYYHVSLQGPSGQLGHDSPNGKTFIDRSKMFLESYSMTGENIAYGPTTAREIVIGLLIDDGVASRGHRKNILSNHFNLVGVSFGKHRDYTYMCVMNFAKK